MTDFDEIMAAIVATLPTIAINANVTRSPQFYWGRGYDLDTFLQVKGKEHFPLIWSVSKEDAETEDEGLWTRAAELNLCTLETRKDLLNTTRIEEGYSFQKVLYPLWVSLERAIQLSQNLSIKEGTLKKNKYPNYPVNDQYEFPVVWDVLKISFTAEFNSDYEC